MAARSGCPVMVPKAEPGSLERIVGALPVGAARLGMTGKLCVHPRQIAPIHDALAPTEVQLAWARKVLDASGTGAAVAVDGQMVDKPVLDRARVLLARSR